MKLEMEGKGFWHFPGFKAIDRLPTPPWHYYFSGKTKSACRKKLSLHINAETGLPTCAYQKMPKVHCKECERISLA